MAHGTLMLLGILSRNKTSENARNRAGGGSFEQQWKRTLVVLVAKLKFGDSMPLQRFRRVGTVLKVLWKNINAHV